MTRVILGSKSPRRKEIFSYFSLPFEQADPSFDEESVPFNGDPVSYVNELSQKKAASLIDRFSTEIIVTADTIVYRDGTVYGKPKSEKDAFRILSELQGKWHSVFTGVTVRQKDIEFQQHEETKVLFNHLTESQMRHYHTKLHWADKAGGYDIRMGGGLVVQKIEGCYYNVTGLPINTVRKLLLNFGIELWDFLK